VGSAGSSSGIEAELRNFESISHSLNQVVFLSKAAGKVFAAIQLTEFFKAPSPVGTIVDKVPFEAQ
jgi:hypothetical protein